MKKTYAQFAGIFVGVLVMHLVVASALMKSAETPDPEPTAGFVDPTYHFSSDQSSSADSTHQDPGSNESEKMIPDAFADADAGAPSPSGNSVPPPPIPEREPSAPVETKAPNPESTSPTRRLTVNQLLAGESRPKVKSIDQPEKADTPGEESPTPRIKSLEPVETVPPTETTPSAGGPRKFRSLNGSN